MTTGYMTDQITVTPHMVEAIYRRACDLRHEPYALKASILQQGMRAAKARDAKMLQVLDKGIEILSGMAEEQSGRTRRSAAGSALRVPPTEVNLWRGAYTAMDEGDPPPHLAYLYGAVGLFAGVVRA